MYYSKILKVAFILSVLAMLIPASIAQGQITGSAVIRSSSGVQSDQLVVALNNVAVLDADHVYEGWLVSDDGSDELSIGTLAINDAGGISHTYTHDTLNLASVYSEFMVTIEPADDTDTTSSGSISYSDKMPSGGIAHVRHLLSAGDGSDASTKGLWSQSDVAHLHATNGVDATAIGDIQSHAQHVINTIEGTSGANFDADSTNPGDGHGLLTYAADAKADAAAAVTGSHDDSVFLLYEPKVSVSADNVASWATLARDSALLVAGTSNKTVAQAHMSNAATYLERARDGYDADRDGTIESITDEGGAVQAHVAAQDMASFIPITYVPPAAPVVELPATGDQNLSSLALLALALGGLLILSGRFLLLRRTTS